MRKEANSVERIEKGLMATTYLNESNNLPDSQNKTRKDSFEVSILRKLRKVATLDEADKSVTQDYIIGKLGLVGKEAEQVWSSSTFDTCKFLVQEIDDMIRQWSIEDEVTDSQFNGENKKMELIDSRSVTVIDVTKGMVLILPMKSWGEDGGAYAKKLVSDTEKRSVIKVVFKYKNESDDEYSFSEFMTVKLSDLTYGFEGVGKLEKNIGKLKHLMDYTPAGMEVINFEMLYMSLCRFHNDIEPDVVSSNKLDFNDTYRILVEEVYKLVENGQKGILGEDYYKLEEAELKNIAKETGYDLEELVVQLKERGFLETDKDKKSRRKKTVTRDGKKGKYYCILTSDRFNELCNKKADKLSLPSDKFDECITFYQTLKGSNMPLLEEKAEVNREKQKNKKKIVGMLDINAYLAQF
ncbi:MAG: hypothetical protein K0S47_2407 [Herbinix sp.]|jgi:hypothetical protein|nr:hypothetical protein [Herbinix sp.]